MTPEEQRMAPIEEKPEYYLISRGLYFRPEARGYTGIRDEAGLFVKSYAENYAKHGDPAMVHKDDQKMAPEFMPSAYNDLVINHLKSQRDQAVAKLAALSAPAVQPEDVSIKTFNWLIKDLDQGKEAEFFLDNFPNGVRIVDKVK